jgi:serine/threonine protein kinase
LTVIAERYELGPLLGRGGMAEVRTARDVRLERPVAVKMLLPEAARDPACRRRFEIEASVGAGLSHPNIVSVLDAGEDGGLPFIVMERVPGTTLKDVMGLGPMSPDRVEQVAVDVLAGLRAAHQAGVIHRDLKPGNILASGDGHWKVADFGIVHQSREDTADLTRTGMIIGTPAYIAPERFFGQPATPSSDIYSLGVVLYEALTGRRPFEVWDSYPWSGAVAGSPPAPVRAVRPDAPAPLAAAIDRSLSLDPATRFTSAEVMAAALSKGEPTRVMRIPPTGPRGGRRRTAAVAAGTAALAAGVALALAFAAHGNSPASTVPSTRPTVPSTTTTVAPTTVLTTPPPTAAPARPAPPHPARGPAGKPKRH